MQYYNVPGAADDDICGLGVKTRLAEYRGVPTHFIMIICPPVLEQIDGQPKMFADLLGTDLSDNTRPTILYDPPLTDQMTLYMLAWEGMSIDQLRAKVLSVYIGRTILIVTNAKYADSPDHIRGKSSKLSITIDIVNLLAIKSGHRHFTRTLLRR